VALITRAAKGPSTPGRTRRRLPTIPTVSGPTGTLYRGREGMWSWVGHRITGVLIFVFLLVHVLDTSLVRVSPEAYDAVIATYKNPVVGLGEAGLVAAVLFHAFNGVRIMLVDFWRQGARYQRQMFWGVVGLSAALFVPFLVRHLGIVFGSH
jgi:succinate dehydrogenase / fumarate reductase cytochrome b subunit